MPSPQPSSRVQLYYVVRAFSRCHSHIIQRDECVDALGHARRAPRMPYIASVGSGCFPAQEMSPFTSFLTSPLAIYFFFVLRRDVDMNRATNSENETTPSWLVSAASKTSSNHFLWPLPSVPIPSFCSITASSPRSTEPLPSASKKLCQARRDPRAAVDASRRGGLVEGGWLGLLGWAWTPRQGTHSKIRRSASVDEL